MRINIDYRDLWGNIKKREMRIIYQSSKMTIARYTIQNAQKPLVVDETRVLENGYTAVSFIEYGKWYIIEKIFDFDAVPTGFLVRLVTPVEENLMHLSTLDLFIKFWVSLQNEYRSFGTKMFRKISEDGLFTETVERTARETADELILRIEDGTFPPDFVKDFKIEKGALY